MTSPTSSPNSSGSISYSVGIIVVHEGLELGTSDSSKLCEGSPLGVKDGNCVVGAKDGTEEGSFEGDSEIEGSCEVEGVKESNSDGFSEFVGISDGNDDGSVVGTKDGTEEGSWISVDGNSELEGSCEPEGDKEVTNDGFSEIVGISDGNDDGICVVGAKDGTKEGSWISVEGNSEIEGSGEAEGGKEGTSDGFSEIVGILDGNSDGI